MQQQPQLPAPSDLAALRARLAQVQGPAHWRSLEELAGDPQFQELLRREFPSLLPTVDMDHDMSRRGFLQLMGASLALAGLSACARQPLERIVPYVKQPEEIIPGRPLYFATALARGGYGVGVLVESHQGRPTKIEGNPEHPASLGATDLFTQAEILTLYDPERSKTPTYLGEIRSWTAFLQDMQGRMEAQRGLQGGGLRLLTQTVTSPTLAGQIRELLARYPQARWHQYEPAGRDAVRVGAQRAFGEWVESRYDLTRARTILAVEADFLHEGPAAVRYARDFAATHRVRDGQTGLSRLYCVESTPTLTGTVADHRLRLAPHQGAQLLAAVAAALGVPGVAAPALDAELLRQAGVIAKDLQRQPQASLVVVGEHAPPELHVLAHAMNAALDNVGHTVVYTEPVEAEPVDQVASLRALTDDLRAGKVELLVIVGGNPVYDAPADLDFAQALQKAALRVHLGLYEDETSAYCQWHLSQTHALEGWTDLRAFDGTVTIAQPLIDPLYDGRSPHRLLASLLGQAEATDEELVRAHWQRRGLGAAGGLGSGSSGGTAFEQAWRKAVHDGLLPETRAELRSPKLRPDAAAQAAAEVAAGAPAGLALVFRPDPTIHDGRFSNNGWLQECPKPLTKLTWDNAALLSPATAQRLSVRSEDLLLIRHDGRELLAPVWVLPGQAEDTVTLHLGYGRTRSGHIGNGCGFDAFRVRRADTPWVALGALAHAAGGQRALATTQTHHSMEGRHLVRAGTLEQFQHEPDFAQHVLHGPGDRSMYEPHPYEGHAWGLAIDLSACTGCNACLLACQAENNVPIVGRTQVANGREMHWIRIDRYFEGELDDPQVHHQPVMCMQCEQAPCEVVCPVAATSHSDEGLNDMTYNRCVGTRYCSNNCPYKVRRFNFLEWHDRSSETLKMQRNPDVTVRMRGVMEKCTYCVQRINGARIDAKREGRELRDGEIVTACQQVCPSQAIVFGDLNDPASQVARWKAQPLNYGILSELGTRPRTTYLAKVRNPNPELLRS